MHTPTNSPLPGLVHWTVTWSYVCMLFIHYSVNYVKRMLVALKSQLDVFHCLLYFTAQLLP